MRVHVVGLGKLGLPIALTLAQHGHEVSGWDTSRVRVTDIASGCVPEEPHEPGLAEFLRGAELLGNFRLKPLRPDRGADGVASDPDLILICVQTPHEPRFEGATPLLDDPQDFDYAWLRAAVRETTSAVWERGIDPLVVTVSTCLPGTFERYIRPLLGGVRYAYNPLFIAMGSVIADFCDPEFVLIGCDWPDDGPPRELADLYRPIYGNVWGRPPFRAMSITSAELTKVAYNAFLGFKLMLANTIAMVCDAANADADDVMNTLKLADKRLVSPAYLTPGMGDGGPCHPRDQIALSWLAGELRLPHNPFEVVIRAREAHARWLAGLLWREAMNHGLPPVILGRAYKPESTLETGSPALLVQHFLTERYGYPVIAQDEPFEIYPQAAYLLATPHEHFLTAAIPFGSVMVDPWGLFPGADGVRVIQPGRREERYAGR